MTGIGPVSDGRVAMPARDPELQVATVRFAAV